MSGLHIQMAFTRWCMWTLAYPNLTGRLSFNTRTSGELSLICWASSAGRWCWYTLSCACLAEHSNSDISTQNSHSTILFWFPSKCMHCICGVCEFTTRFQLAEEVKMEGRCHRCSYRLVMSEAGKTPQTSNSWLCAGELLSKTNKQNKPIFTLD